VAIINKDSTRLNQKMCLWSLF